jgi:hypothetical protein
LVDGAFMSTRGAQSEECGHADQDHEAEREPDPT